MNIELTEHDYAEGMRPYTIWMEGIACTGNWGGAVCHGIVWARSFQRACDKLFLNDRLYNKEELTYYGCSLFDNEQDARRSFG